MAQYNIIGGDGKEYGPISYEQVQNWIREGRANAQTMIHTDSNPKWIPLGQCPEFASILGRALMSNPNINHGDGVPPQQNVYQPITGQGTPVAHHPNAKSKIVAGVLGLMFPGLGIHRFYLGYIGIGIAQIFAIFACGAGVLWGFIEGILILCGSTITADADGIPLRDD